MNPPPKGIIALTVLAILGASAFAGWWWLSHRTRGTDARLSPWSGQSVARTTLSPEPMHRQADPRWADETTGGSGEPLRAVGCTLCCVSMALAQHGITLDPAELNRKLKESNGFTEQGWIKWDAVGEATARRARVDVPRQPTHDDIDGALAAGCPVLVKVLLRPGVQHWVLLVGRDQRDYLMKDPLGDGKNLEKLSSLRSDIHAVRIVRKA